MGEQDCEELSLELSIGGKYGKAEKVRDFCGENARCEEFFSGISADPQRRREIQALRRHEARRKREVKKWRGVNNVEDKMVLEARKFQGRVGDRETREKDYFLEEKSRKRELASENKNGCLYAKVQLAEANAYAFGSSDSENSNGVKSVEQCSSAVSDYHSISQKEILNGVGTFSTIQAVSRASITKSTSTFGHRKQKTHHCLVGANTSNPQRYDALSKEKRDEAAMPSSCTGNAGRLSRMPCVSATGDGPNATTVTGFLYRYDKTEVSIMCVCHGSSFSPAEFVKHAGGAAVSHPLRHITVVPLLGGFYKFM